MRKSSDLQIVRASNIKKLMEREGLKQKDLAGMIDVAKKDEPFKPMEEQNLSACLIGKKRQVSDQLCRKIGKLFPQYNIAWLLGDANDEDMLKEDIARNYVKRSDATNSATLLVLDSALREVCAREEIDIPILNQIPELLLLQAQLRDYAESLMWNYTKHREHSHVWGYIDQIGEKK